MLKLLAITPLLGRSGSEIALINLLASLTNDFKITVFTSTKNPLLKQELPPEIRLITPEKRFKRKSLLGNIIEKFQHLYRPMDEIEKWMDNEGFDIVLLNTYLSLRFYSWLDNKGKKTILYVHETELMLEKIEMEKFRKVINEVDLILCSSNYVKEYLNIYGRTEAIEVLQPSLDFTRFILPVDSRNLREVLDFKESDYVWGMCGATTINKNPKMFLEAAEQLLKENPTLRFLWIGARGKNAYEDYLVKEIEFKGLQENIKIIEMQSNDYYQYLNLLDGFVLTSFSESFSLSALEAACFNKPVISFPCGGVYEAVPKELLWVTEEFSVKELVHLMKTAMKNPMAKISLKEIETLLKKDRSSAGMNFRAIIECSL